MKPTVLLFGLSPMEVLMTKNTLSGLGLTVTAPEQSQYTQPIGSLASGTVPVLSAAPFRGKLEEPVVVLCYMTEDLRDATLDTLRNRGLCTKALKAILTPVNQHWNIVMLLEELRRERSIMRQRISQN